MRPVALYELGAHAARGAARSVGTDPAYARRLDVVGQLALERPEMTVHGSLRETVRAAVTLETQMAPDPGIGGHHHHVAAPGFEPG
ncbi:hypothetical protein SLUN_23670 [Streptomyces lunaelactis]|uniref:Uncharacterized protein n=1 Tax=Streptomyces lunaelactis TaxID=1535768 RepID=A0A2R4T6M4_9ACTN|nr:hypothetical protein [Streptomyces lunaelactis]AVZ74721.1 hypothetical protein SLUN_23670 [Streptomyces lunaelactis]NUK88578.1 hypothetical protein [Streptomyces lunaelactis]